MAAAPGTPEYGRLTVMLAPWLHAEALFEVGPGAFRPEPKVWSAVVRLTVRSEPAFEVSPHFGAVVSAAFSPDMALRPRATAVMRLFSTTTSPDRRSGA